MAEEGNIFYFGKTEIVNVETCRIAGQGRILGNNAVAVSEILDGMRYVGVLAWKVRTCSLVESLLCCTDVFAVFSTAYV